MLEILEFPKTLKVNKTKLIRSLEKSIQSEFKLENISVIFVSEKKIQDLNKEFRNIDRPTDVLSFNYNTQDLFGEIYVCLEYINKNGQGIPTLEEVVRMVIHGILHLYGYDHNSEFIDEKQENLERMFSIQENLVKKVMEKL